ncbi:MAG TPA: hypothetical protein VHQ47_07515 [Phycisphaerae bacterium]|nr:hypothetical protein [Phycisphaerae bacterium]
MNKDSAIWTFTLTADKADGIPTVCKVRRALKGLLRGYGLKCLEAIEITTGTHNVGTAATPANDVSCGTNCNSGLSPNTQNQ